MSKYSISMSLGTSAIQHTQRDEKYVFEQQSKGLLKNVDKTKTYQNVILKDCQSLEEEFNKTFESATLSYNDKQKAEHRLNRVIDNYYQYVKNQKQGKKAMKTDYEYVLQFGNSEDGFPDNSKEMLIKTFNELKVLQDKGFIHINYAAIHMDEATPHMHINITPIAKDYKKGMPQRPAINKMISQMLKVDRYKAYEDLLSYVKDGVMEKILNDEGYERLVKGNNFAHQDVENYKKSINLQKNVDNLSQQEEEFIKRNQDLKDEISGNLQKAEELNKSYEELHQEYDELSSSKERLRLEYNELKSTETELNNDIKGLRNQLGEQVKYANTRDEYNGLKENIRQIITDIKNGWTKTKDTITSVGERIRQAGVSILSIPSSILPAYASNISNNTFSFQKALDSKWGALEDKKIYSHKQEYLFYQEYKLKNAFEKHTQERKLELEKDHIKPQKRSTKERLTERATKVSQAPKTDYSHPKRDAIAGSIAAAGGYKPGHNGRGPR